MAKSVAKPKKPGKTRTSTVKSARSAAVKTRAKPRKSSGGGSTGLSKGALENIVAAYVAALLVDFTQSADFAMAVENIVILMQQYQTKSTMADQHSPGSYYRQGSF